jgi:hypothetical protein
VTVAGEGSAGLIHTLIDRLAAEYAGEPYRSEIAEAREDYFNRAGKVFEDDAELFEGRVVSFLEWYVIERPLEGGPPPVLRALERANADAANADASAEATRKALAAIATSHRSVFDLDAVSEDVVRLEDLLGGARFDVVERRSTIGFEAGDLVEARLVFDGERVIFGKTFLFHPRDAREEALKAIDEALAKGTSRAEIMFALSRLHVRWHRHGHVNAARVYRGGG